MENPRMGVLGHAGEYRPRYGLWIDTSRECQNAVQGLLSEGWDCDVVLKYGARCPSHCNEQFRPVIALSVYARMLAADMLEDKQGCYLREVFFPNLLNLRKAAR